jgi:hypothetical protein
VTVVSIVSPLAFSVGSLAWSLTEYSLHRFIGHGPKRKKSERLLDLLTPSGFAAEFYREHTAHHVDPTYFAPTSRKVLLAGVAAVATSALASAVVGPRRGVSFALGFSGAFLGYEILHRRVHTHAPIGPYTRWMHKNHWFHHRSPKSDHGVTSPLWDHAFGTHVEPGKVKLGRAIAPAWLLDESGEVRAEHRDDFELVPAARREERAAAA